MINIKMDAETRKIIQVEVQNSLTTSQNTMMTEMKNLISSEMGKISKQNQAIADKQLSKIEETLSDSYKFKRRGTRNSSNTTKVLSQMKEADDHLSKDMDQLTEQNVLNCREALSQGMTIVQQRQKMIKLADSSDAGWLVVHEYVSNPLADKSDDEKRIFKAQSRADRKLKDDKKKRKSRAGSHHTLSVTLDPPPDSQRGGRISYETRALLRMRGEGALEE